MELASTDTGLRIQEGPRVFVLELGDSPSPLDELFILAAAGVVGGSPPCDGRTRAEEILCRGDDFSKALAVRICAEFLGRRRDG